MRSSMPSPPLTMQLLALSIILLLIACSVTRPTEAFSVVQPARTKPAIRRIVISSVRLCATSEKDGATEPKPSKKKGDSLRDATGIRPSLHPTTINCIAEALLLRSQCVLGKSKNKDGEEIAIDTANSQTEPLQIAITAGGIAMAAIDQRKEAAKTDETTDVFTMEESQLISGRVVGVVMRTRELEQLLIQKVNAVKWVRKYGEEESFGVLKKECQLEEEGNQILDEALEKQLAETIKTNPLFRMNRAECLLALFLSTVEQPKMELLGEDVAGGSKVDFIDADRLEVLLPV